MNKDKFFELISSYVSKNHPKVFMEACDEVYEDLNFLIDDDIKEEEGLYEEVNDFLRLFKLKLKV